MSQAVRFLEERSPHSIWDFTLDRMHIMRERLGLQRIAKQVITVAGTNGKGSTVQTISTLLRALGYQVVSYFSPHLISITERIQNNKGTISEVHLLALLHTIETKRAGLSLTFFEWLTLAAGLFTKESNADYAVLEVGLGGRLDAVNVWDADLSIITGIDWDHMQFLGNTLDAIALEKAHIMRQGKPAILGATAARTVVQDFAKSHAIPIWIEGRDFAQDAKQYSVPNLSVALGVAALKKLGLLPSDPKWLVECLEKVRLNGRYEIHTRPHLTVYDVAHNAQSARYLYDKLCQDFKDYTWHMVWASLADKDITAIVEPFVKHTPAKWYVPQLTAPRAAPVVELVRVLFALGITAKGFDSVALALDAAWTSASHKSVVVVFGSFHTVGEGLEYYQYHDVRHN